MAAEIKDSWIYWGENALSTVQDMEKIEKLPIGATVYLYGADDSANVFNYSPRYIIEILNEDETINTILSDKVALEYQIPYCI